MKKLIQFAFWVFLFWVWCVALTGFLHAQTQTTVTGVVQDVTGVLATSGYVEFDLSPQNGGVQYFVSGIGVIAPQTAQCGIDGSGNVKNLALSGPCLVWGNSTISPANTTYTVVLAPGGIPINTVAGQCINGGSYSLSAPVFCGRVALNPQSAFINVQALNANLIPGVAHVFTLGSNSFPYAQGFFDNVSVTNYLGNPTFTGNVTIGGTFTANLTSILNGTVSFNSNTQINPSGTATSGAGFDSRHHIFCGSVWNGSAAVADCWEIYVNDFNGAFSTGGNLIINHLLSGGSGRVLDLSDLVVGDSRSATVSLNSNSRAFDTQGAYFESGSQNMLWEMANTVSCDGCALASTIFRSNFVPIFTSACAGCQGEFALGGSGTNGASGNYTGPPKWLWPTLRGSSFFTGSWTHSNTALRSWNMPDASGNVILDTLGLFTAPVRLTNGLVSAPSYTWTNDTGIGWYRNAADDIRYADAGNDILRIDATGFSLNATTGLQWGSGGVTSRDTGLWRVAAATLAVGNTTPGDFSGTVKTKTLLYARSRATTGTSLVAGDFALSAGFGNTAAVSAIRGTDSAFSVTITPNGTGIAANPTITLTYHDGTWTNRPIISITRADGNAPNTMIWIDQAGSSATQGIIQFVGTPSAGVAYVINVIVVGV